MNADWIASRLEDRQVQVLDARLPEFTAERTPAACARGPCPRRGATSPSRACSTSSGKLKPVESLRGASDSSVPGADASPIATSGQQATLIYFVARYVGSTARLYDGSFRTGAAVRNCRSSRRRSFETGGARSPTCRC